MNRQKYATQRTKKNNGKDKNRKDNNEANVVNKTTGKVT